MGRWDSPPPSKVQRWTALHAVQLQIAGGILAIASAALAVIVLRSDGWGVGVLCSAFTAVGFLMLMWTPRSVARWVDAYDRDHSEAPTDPRTSS